MKRVIFKQIVVTSIKLLLNIESSDSFASIEALETFIQNLPASNSSNEKSNTIRIVQQVKGQVKSQKSSSTTHLKPSIFNYFTKSF